MTDGASRKPFRGEGGPAPTGVNAVDMVPPEGPRPAGYAINRNLPCGHLRVRRATVEHAFDDRDLIERRCATCGRRFRASVVESAAGRNVGQRVLAVRWTEVVA